MPIPNNCHPELKFRNNKVILFISKIIAFRSCRSRVLWIQYGWTRDKLIQGTKIPNSGRAWCLQSLGNLILPVLSQTKKDAVSLSPPEQNTNTAEALWPTEADSPTFYLLRRQILPPFVSLRVIPPRLKCTLSISSHGSQQNAYVTAWPFHSN